MNILQEIYLGNISPSEKTFKHKPEYMKIISAQSNKYDELNDTLTEKQKETFEGYIQLMLDSSWFLAEEMFSDGFRLGALIMIEVMREDKELCD